MQAEELRCTVPRPRSNPTSWKGTKLTSVVSLVFAMHTVLAGLACNLCTGAGDTSLQNVIPLVSQGLARCLCRQIRLRLLKLRLQVSDAV